MQHDSLLGFNAPLSGCTAYPRYRTQRPWTTRIAQDLGIELMPDSVPTSTVVLATRSGEGALMILHNGSYKPWAIPLISNSCVVQRLRSYTCFIVIVPWQSPGVYLGGCGANLELSPTVPHTTPKLLNCKLADHNDHILPNS